MRGMLITRSMRGLRGMWSMSRLLNMPARHAFGTFMRDMHAEYAVHAGQA